jgi:hypothetical protein
MLFIFFIEHQILYYFRMSRVSRIKIIFFFNIDFLKSSILLYIIMVSLLLYFVSLSRDCLKSQS